MLEFLLWVAWTAVVSYGLSYLGGLLISSDIPEADIGETPDAASRSWNPHTTQREGIARPRAYGENLHHGNILAKWTDVIDNREVLFMILGHGDGVTEGVNTPFETNIFLNDQPLSNFTSVEVQERRGTMNQTVMSGFEKTKLQYEQGSKLLLDEPITVTTSNDFFEDIEFTLMFPNGLYKYQKTGKRKSSSVTVKVRIRIHGGIGWQTVFNEAISKKIYDPYFKIFSLRELGFICERGTQYDLEITNLTGTGERHVNELFFKSYREVIDVPFTYPGRSVVGIRAIATEQLSGNIDVKVIRKDKIIWTWNGTVETLEYSRNRAWIVYDIFTQPVITGDGDGVPYEIEYYEGVAPESMDLEFFFNWAAFCAAQKPDGYGGYEDRIACDTIIDFQTDVWTLANEIANIGRAHLYWRGHVLTGWIDEEVTEVTALVTMNNVMTRSWKSSWTEPDELAGKIEVFFQDRKQGYERMPATLPNESAGKYTRIISLEGIGITTRGAAIHVGSHVLKRNELISNINTFRQYKDAFRYKLGDVLRIQHLTPEWGEGFRVIRSTANNKVTLDRHCMASTGDLLFIQCYNEVEKEISIDSYTVESVVGKVVTISETWNIRPKKNNEVATGKDGDTVLRRIIQLDSLVSNFWDVTVETYDANLFAIDDSVPDNPDLNYIWDKPANQLIRPLTRADVVDIINQVSVPQVDVDSPVTSNCTWSGNNSDTVSWSKTDADDDIVFRYKGVDYPITPGSTTDEFIYWNPSFNTTFQTTNNAAVAVSQGNWYMCRNIAGVAWPTVPFAQIHAGVIQVGTIVAAQYYELRNTFVYNGDDSLDNSKPFEVPFKIVSEMTAVVSIKLSFRIMPYRAYSTAASSGGGATSGDGGGAGGGSGGGQTTSAGGVGYPETTDSAEANGGNSDYENGADLYTTYESNGNHRHGVTGRSHRHGLGSSFGGHTHGVDFPDHTHTVSNHTHTGAVHSHSTPNHTHGISYGLHEESNSPTVHFHINNGAGFGGASADYTTDQLDLAITGSISGSGWKAIRFDTNLRCRIFAIIECKIDITA